MHADPGALPGAGIKRGEALKESYSNVRYLSHKYFSVGQSKDLMAR